MNIPRIAPYSSLTARTPIVVSLSPHRSCISRYTSGLTRFTSVQRCRIISTSSGLVCTTRPARLPPACMDVWPFQTTTTLSPKYLSPRNIDRWKPSP